MMHFLIGMNVFLILSVSDLAYLTCQLKGDIGVVITVVVRQ